MDVIIHIVTSPFIQLFLLGMLAGLFRSDLELPQAFTKALSLYLMLAIGLKGGTAIAHTQTPFHEIVGVLAAGIILSFSIPMLGYALLGVTTRLSRLDRAAIAAHYGSVSAVTFSFAMGYLHARNIPFSGYIVTLMALMESPAILAGLMLAKSSQHMTSPQRNRLFSMSLMREVFLNGSILLLLGGILVGYTANPDELDKVTPYLIEPFYGILCLFLLELGLLASKELRNIRGFPIALLAYGFYMPILGSFIGMAASLILGLSEGDMVLFATLCASASYIAVPAALKIALPQANAAYYVTCSLCLTFPFNLIVGVPLYHRISEWLIG